MKKVLSFLIVGLLFIMTGCTVQEKDINNKQSDDIVVNVSGEELKLNYETHHLNMYYKESISEFNTNTMGSFCNISYAKNGDIVFQIRLVYYKNKSIEEVMSKSSYDLQDKKINNLEYKYFEYDDNGVPGHTYIYNYNGTTYTISFASDKDITIFEQIFMENVNFKEE